MTTASGEPVEVEEGVLRLVPGDGIGRSPRHIPIQRDTTLALVAGSRWTAHFEVAGFWSPPQVVVVPGETREPMLVRIRLWPTVPVLATLEGAEAEIEELAVTFQPIPAKADRVLFGRSKVECESLEETRFSCELPVGSLDLSFRSPGYVPSYHWDVTLEPGKKKDFGSLRLRVGASISGNVDVAEGRFEHDRCVVRLIPLQATGGSSVTAGRLRGTATLEGRVNERGFFQLQGASPGTYLLEIEHPGFAAARLAPVDLVRGKETTLLETLQLQRALELEVSVDPRESPSGKPWRVWVQRAFDYSSRFDGPPVFDGPVEEGRVRIPEQAPGRFWVTLSDGAQRYHSNAQVLVTSAADAFYRIELDLVEVRGLVSLESEPLASTLYFGGRHAAEGVRMEAGEEGTFQGLLPRAGAWLLEVESEVPPRLIRRWVEVSPDSKGRARVEVELPDTEITGRVLEESGRPATRATVYLAVLGESLRTRTDARGDFSFYSFEEGSVSLSASAGSATSESVATEVVEGVPAGPFTLQLESVRTVRGSVVSPLGPVIGAAVRVEVRDSVVGGGGLYRTGPEGVFEVEIPERARRIQVTVSPPGAALQSFLLEASEMLPPITVGRDSGTLVVSQYTEAMPPPLVVFEQDGLVLPFGDVVRWAQAQEGGVVDSRRGVIRIPRLAPGNYRVCFATRAALNRAGFSSGDWRSGLDTCESGFLPVGGSLELQLADLLESEESGPAEKGAN